jgi:hypothetical protein
MDIHDTTDLEFSEHIIYDFEDIIKDKKVGDVIDKISFTNYVFPDNYNGEYEQGIYRFLKFEILGKDNYKLHYLFNDINKELIGNIDTLESLLSSDFRQMPTEEMTNLYPLYSVKNDVEGLWTSSLDNPMISDLLQSYIMTEEFHIHPGTKNIVRDYIHPSFYPLILTDPLPDKENFWNRKYEQSKYQWLPCDIEVDENKDVTIVSKINNFVEKNNSEIMTCFETVFEALLPGFEQVWTYAQMMNFTGDDDSSPDVIVQKKPEIKTVNTTCEITTVEKEKIKAIERKKDDCSTFSCQTISFANCKLQTVVKLVDYVLEPGESFEGVWHYEGLPHENIVMTGIYYFDVDDGIEGGNIEFKRITSNSEAKYYFWNSNQDKTEWHEEMCNGFTPLGQTETKQDKLIVFPNCHAHKVQPLVNNTDQTLSRKMLVFFFIDPFTPIASTATIPLIPRTLTKDEAIFHQGELMKERKFHKESLNPRAIELCEH